MNDFPHVMPRQQAPALEVPTVDGGIWRLSDQAPGSFTMIVVYRGLHCPICSRYLADLDRRIADFSELGVGVIALSGDDEDRARTARTEWKLDTLTLGYGLDLETARAWGLYISSGIGKTSAGVEEPALFPEPGLFLVRADGTIFFASVQTMPFARPGFADILGATKFVIERNYPARGEVVDVAAAQAAE